MTSFLDSLNEEQRKACECTEGYVRVLAGAGTGKTKTLTARYAYLVSILGLSPSNVLCVTFTNKAANEMKERILKLCSNIALPWVNTFHGFCADFLRKHADVLGYPLNFAIISVNEVKEILKPIYKKLGINGREFSLQDGWEFIDKLKSKDLTYVKEMLSCDSNTLLELVKEEGLSIKMQMFYLYLYEERISSLMDFDDLIAFTLTILHENAEICESYQKRLQYIEVDEFQDIDHLQYELVEILSAKHKNLFVVGDPDQTIYTFRGADVSFFVDFPKRHVPTTSFAFKKNYRSQGAILDCAYTLISKNPENGRQHLEAMRQDIVKDDMRNIEEINLKKQEEFNLKEVLNALESHTSLDLVTDPKFEIVDDEIRTFKPIVCGAMDEGEEADFISRQIKNIRSYNQNYTIAVLYRSRHVSLKIEQALVNYQIPYKVYGDFNFFERREILDVLAFCRACLNPHDNTALRRIINVPIRGFGKSRMQRLEKDAFDHDGSLYEALVANIDNPFYYKRSRIKAFLQVLENLHAIFSLNISHLMGIERVLNDFLYEDHLKNSGEKERLESLAQLRQMAQIFEKSAGESVNIADFLKHLVLYTTKDDDDDVKKVALMTVHNAKGLEFDYVFIAGLNEGTFPSSKSVNYQDLQEERRLLYVAMTRACRQLFITTVNGHTAKGREQVSSRFIEDLDVDEVYFNGIKPLFLDNKVALKTNVEDGEFKIGDRVFHCIFGPGTILDCDKIHGVYEIKFEALKESRNLSFNAPLEPLKN